MSSKVKIRLVATLLSFSLGFETYFAPAGQTISICGTHYIKTSTGWRTYRLHAPSTLKKTGALHKDKNKKRPLLIMLHGALVPSAAEEWHCRLNKEADSKDFFVVYPQGRFATWNAGQCCGIAQMQKADDVGFISCLIEKLKTEYPIDEERVALVGISNGAMMAHRIARAMPDKISSLSVVAGCMYPTDEAEDKEKLGLPILAMNSLKDRVIPYDGGRGGLFWYRITSPPVENAVNYWVERNGCNLSSEVDADEYKLFTYQKVDSDNEVLFYQLKVAGHVWPGGRGEGAFGVVSGRKPTKNVDAAEIVASFALRHKRSVSDSD